uniref:Tubulin delta chain n=1 Tax=Tetradesmus obliquus TaxID=3088 RepID=A0A383VAF0_TETOB|eukprot:jgi/Sobl393_1/3598/SZX61910.1
MPVITVQLGQCGNQLGAAWFDTLAEELSSGAYGPYAADAYFQQQDTLRSSSNSNAAASLAARAVLVDMEPKVIYSARQRAQASSHGWCYSSGSAASGQSGSGNNWAMGHHQWGPRMAPAVLELVRRQAEACDVLEGFLLLQSVAGGTGAGAGTFIAEALVDEYSSAHMLNCCVWPYASGEVTVQPFNSLLSMTALAQISSGMLLLQNEALHATCTRLLGIRHPGFKDLNAVAARALASALLPCRARPTTAGPTAAAATAAMPGTAQSSQRPSPGSRSQQRLGSSEAEQQQQQQQQQAWCGMSVGSPQLHSMADLTCHLFSHPSYRLASIRCVPQLPAGSVDFTTFTWPALLRRLKAMGVSGSYLEEGLSGFTTSAPGGLLPLHKYKNRAASSMLLLRGQDAGSVPVSEFDDPHFHAPWAVDPLLVASHSAKFAGWQMAATLLATDQACVAELQPMLAKAYAMASARAYLHQYEAYGLGEADMQQCFAAVEDVLAAYAAL